MLPPLPPPGLNLFIYVTTADLTVKGADCQKEYYCNIDTTVLQILAKAGIKTK